MSPASKAALLHAAPNLVSLCKEDSAPTNGQSNAAKALTGDGTSLAVPGPATAKQLCECAVSWRVFLARQPA